jgi:hypothetical protein
MRLTQIPCTQPSSHTEPVTFAPMRTTAFTSRRVAWPEAELRVVDDAGHSAFERGTAPRLLVGARLAVEPTLAPVPKSRVRLPGSC